MSDNEASLLNFEEAKKMIVWEEAENEEIIYYKASVTCDLSIWTRINKAGGECFEVRLCFPHESHPDFDHENSYGAIAFLVQGHDGESALTSLEQVIKLLGIPPDARVWESEQ